MLDLGAGQTRKLSLTEPELRDSMPDVRKLVQDELEAGTCTDHFYSGRADRLRRAGALEVFAR